MNHYRPTLRAGLSGLLAIALAVLTGCATTGRVLSPGGYAEEGGRYRAAAASGDTGRQIEMAQRAANRAERSDEVLYRLEEGALRALAGDLTGSTTAFQRATDIFEAERAQPIVRVSQGFFSATALATNDRALPYESAGFERLMAHNLLALNHLRVGRADFAQIALNGAVAEMDYLRDKAAALDSARRDRAQSAGIQSGAIRQATEGARERLAVDARPDLKPYHNALTFYLQSLLFAQGGDEARAQIAMRRAAELVPGHPSVEAVLRDGWRGSPDDALVVIVLADGLVARKTEVNLPFVWDDTILQIVMPLYGGNGAVGFGAPLELGVGDRALLRPAAISDLDAQARQELADRYPGIFLRQILRLVTKYQVQQRLEKENPWAGLAAQVFNLITDRADTRSWSTLPATVAVDHAAVAPGAIDLVWPQAAPRALDLPPGSLLLLLETRAGNTVSRDAVLFDRAGKAVHPFTMTNSNQP